MSFAQRIEHHLTLLLHARQADSDQLSELEGFGRGRVAGHAAWQSGEDAVRGAGIGGFLRRPARRGLTTPPGGCNVALSYRDQNRREFGRSCRVRAGFDHGTRATTTRRAASVRPTSHDFTGSGTFPFPTTSNLVNSFNWDPRFGDWIVGSRDGHIERWVDGHSAEKIISLGSTAFSINGVWHLPGIKGDDVPIGGGCIGNGGFTPTDVSGSLPTAGNTGFAFGVHSGAGGDTAVLLLGATAQPVPVNLGLIGITPNCFLRVDNIVTSIPAPLSGVGNGLGKATVALSLPAAAAGVNIIHQWAEIQVTKTNTLGIVVSNGRLKIQ